MSERMQLAVRALSRGEPATIPMMAMRDFEGFIAAVKEAREKNQATTRAIVR